MSDEKTWEDEFFKNNKLMDVSSYQDDRIRDWIKFARYSGYMEACKKRNEENEQLKQQLEEAVIKLEQIAQMRSRDCHKSKCTCVFDAAEIFLAKVKKDGGM